MRTSHAVEVSDRFNLSIPDLGLKRPGNELLRTNMVCISVHFSGTFVASTNFYVRNIGLLWVL